MNEDSLTLSIFQTLLAFDANVDKAIENTKVVLAELFPVGAEDEDQIIGG